MKTLLITGVAGFFGAHCLLHVMKNTDWFVVGLDRLDVSGDLNRVAEILEGNPEYKKRFKFVWHDLKAEINDHIRHELGKPNYIWHLAASTHVDRSTQNPLLFVQDNVVGTCNLLEYCRKLDNIEFIGAFNTDEEFGNAPDDPDFKGYKEWDRHKPSNIYSATKSGASQLCYAYYNTFRLPIISSHCMNMIGEMQNKEKMVILCVKKILNNEIIDIHSYPGAKKAGSRFYVHARNVADAYLFLTENAILGERYNLPGQIELSNLELAEKIAQIIGKKLKYKMIDFHSDRPHHDTRYCLDCTKLYKMGYEYPTDFEESLRRTIWWTTTNKRWLE